MPTCDKTHYQYVYLEFHVIENKKDKKNKKKGYANQ